MFAAIRHANALPQNRGPSPTHQMEQSAPPSPHDSIQRFRIASPLKPPLKPSSKGRTGASQLSPPVEVALPPTPRSAQSKSCPQCWHPGVLWQPTDLWASPLFPLYGGLRNSVTSKPAPAHPGCVTWGVSLHFCTPVFLSVIDFPPPNVGPHSPAWQGP